MKKSAALVALLILAVPIAGAFGALHDQVSFTVSREYFTKFKFLQFGFLDSPRPERVRAAQVGFLASWWMGIPIGLLVAPVALIHRSARATFRLGLLSYLLLVGFTGLFAIAGLLYGFFQTSTIDLREYRGWFVPPGLTHLRSFLCAGYMHNSAYLGGAVGILAAWSFHVFARLKKEPHQPTEPMAPSGRGSP